ISIFSFSGVTNGLPTDILWQFAKRFSIGLPEYRLLPTDVELGDDLCKSAPKKLFYDCVFFILYFLGIQLTLIPMGFLQERLMTQEYISFEDQNKVGRFTEAQFLVLMNRVFALVLSIVVLHANWKREPIHVPPLYKHGYTSFSNTLSSWCQYEALKYVSFPTQTVCKASKILPTMVMGFIVRGERYSLAQCISAIFLAIGASLFFLENKRNAVTEDRMTSCSGVILMIGYLLFDGFTLNWQKKLFDTRPRVSKYQMMFGVNAFSLVLCLVSLAEEGKLVSSFDFVMKFEDVARDVFLLSLCGAFGQVVIYMTLERFGPVVFAVIMTLRQIFSIANSMYIYSHPATPLGIFGLFVVFIAIFFNLYRQYSRPTYRQR
ncbi:unnamed protein product, partial [Enterobius vermicularis]|uniref:Adenosine 3'-phospho 5'-phosphosulfate transporter 1 n=1 Tax=Enterobius vermicularis TaxID=51028 RepID=A0A0N4V278_ENTVE